jgi:Flp pilus assembly protein TadD
MDFPDEHHLRCAAGWLELGNPAEAWIEMSKISPVGLKTGETLALAWKILAAQQRWKEAEAVGREMVREQPTDVSGWINRSFALHELKRTQEARAELLSALEIFPKEFIIPYNLACYACQIGDMEEALTWLGEAVRRGGREQVRAMALNDPDLTPLKKEITKL